MTVKETFLEIPLSEIGESYGRLRLIHPQAEARMVASLGKLGQIFPVVVTRKERYELSDNNASALFIERTASDDATRRSDEVEITITDNTGNELGDVINPDNPIQITVQFDPTTFDPNNFTIYYRDRLADGTWGPWTDGVKNGTIRVIAMDLINSTVTFVSSHLSGFVLSPPAAPGGDGGGGGCFIETLTAGSPTSSARAVLALFLLFGVVGTAGALVCRRRESR